MYKQIVAHSWNGILVSNKKELTLDTCNNMNECQKHVEWKKPDWKEDMWCDRSDNSGDDWQERGLRKPEVTEILVGVVVTWYIIYIFVNSHWMVYLKYMHLTVCNLVVVPVPSRLSFRGSRAVGCVILHC